MFTESAAALAALDRSCSIDAKLVSHFNTQWKIWASCGRVGASRCAVDQRAELQGGLHYC